MNKAIIIQKLGQMPVVGSTLRWYASRYEEGSVVTIRSGLAEGLRWSRHHRYVNGYWTGQYEYDMQQAIAGLLSGGQTFLDVGSNAGFFSLIARRIVGAEGRVISFDPDPDNCSSIREQVAANGFGDEWSVRESAVGAEPGQLVFRRATPGSPKGHLESVETDDFEARGVSDEERIEVPVVTLDGLLDEGVSPDVIKMDIEGAELLALAGAERIIAEARPAWIIETHGPTCERGVRETLGAAGYRFRSVGGEPLSADVAEFPRHFVALPG